VEEARWVQEQIKVDNARRAAAAAAADKEVGEKATRNMPAQERRKEAEESTWTESDEREREGQRGAAEAGRDPTTVAVEKTDDDAIVIDVFRARQQPELVEEDGCCRRSTAT
jgi:hypothetical protein